MLHNPCIFDGMGGEQQGEVAAYIAAKGFNNKYKHFKTVRKKRYKSLKKALALLLTTAMIFALAACTSRGETNNAEHASGTTTDSGALFGIAPENAPIEPLASWVPGKSDNSIIWGKYIIDSSSYTQILGMSFVNEEGLAAFLSDMEFETMATDNHDEDKVSVLPLGIQAGPRNVNHQYDEYLARNGYRLIVYQVYSDIDQEIINISKPYKVDGNKIIIFTDWMYEHIDNDVLGDDYRGSNDAIVTVNTENTIEIEYYFDELNLVLSRNGLSIKMAPREFVDEEPWLMLAHYANDRQGFNGIVYIEHFAVPLRADGSRRLLEGQTRISFSEARFSSIDNPIDPVIELYRNGLMRISWESMRRERVQLPSEPGSWVVEYDESSAIEPNPTELWFRYLWCSYDGIVLIDENGQHYLYQIHSLDFDEAKLVDSLSDDIAFEDLREHEVNQLVEEHSNILETLQNAFIDAGIEVNIDTLTGRVTLDTSFLFGVNEYELTDEGASYLDRFLGVYADVILSDAFADSISEIIVEGHTDSAGTFEYNLELSENRAASVADYCLLRQPNLANIMVTRGMSYSYPVLDENGIEDMAASRRVVFRFILDTDNIGW